jgi:hypothetical protein
LAEGEIVLLARPLGITLRPAPERGPQEGPPEGGMEGSMEGGMRPDGPSPMGGREEREKSKDPDRHGERGGHSGQGGESSWGSETGGDASGG